MPITEHEIWLGANSLADAINSTSQIGGAATSHYGEDERVFENGEYRDT